MMSAITQNSSLSLTNGHTNGERFLLFGNNLHVTITGLQGNMTFVLGVNNNLFLNADSIISQGLLSPPKPETISDLALGTHIRINPAAQEMVPVIVNGFQFDHTATLSVDNGGTPTITPDGHGGSIATFAHVMVDFIGDSNLRASQLNGGPAPSA
jgi:hypothetical protein